MVTKQPKIKQFIEMMRRVFYEGETVRSKYYGLGEVTRSGKHPRVQFFDRPECSVPSDTLRWVAPEVYDAEVLNRVMIERFLTLRVCGYLPPCTAPLPRPEFDLAAAMQRYAHSPPLPFVDSTPPGSGVLYFDSRQQDGADASPGQRTCGNPRNLVVSFDS